jgi:hypothetical protein
MNNLFSSHSYEGQQDQLALIKWALVARLLPTGQAVYILDGLLKNKSVLQPDTVHGDTQGQSEVVFGLAHLLGIKLMPRMRNWNIVATFSPYLTEHIQRFGEYVIDLEAIPPPLRPDKPFLPSEMTSE